ncbi:uncharacterized protein [Paramisgurnus dabryanus]|uniref:uncharacterized protein n=1 Tax=Paramisgurnus dabryanus TaxID=90735 RepID=UPI003CCF8024
MIGHFTTKCSSRVYEFVSSDFWPEPLDKMFHRFLLFMCCLTDVFGYIDEVKSVSVMEGDSVTLQNNVTDIQRDDLIEWRFGPDETLITQINRESRDISINDDVLDGRFKDRLQVDNQTGDLNITNITTHLSGLYLISIITSSGYIRETSSRFNVTVYDFVNGCDTTEAVVRLVISALVGVAAVFVVIYDIRSRRPEHETPASDSH